MAALAACGVMVFALGACGDKDSGNILDSPPAVTGVVINPDTATVGRGQSQGFAAAVQGTNNPAQTVVWSVSGGGSGTSITTGGVLSVAADESASSLTVRATSTFDTSKSGTATVTVTGGGPAPTVTGVTVSPGSATVIRGQTKTFTAAVAGANSPPQTVIWTVEGGGPETSITTGGILTVGATESATSLIVRAASMHDTGKSGTAVVFVFNEGDTLPTVMGVTVTPVSPTVTQGQTETFTATVAGTNSLPQNVAWTVEGGGPGTSITTGGLLTVAVNESASSLTVRATSVYDNTKSGMATVTLPPPAVLSVTVSPASPTVVKGQTQAFTAAVEGTGSPSQTVVWNVEGGGPGTSITPSGGVLTVAANESATSLTVRATSTYDYTKSGTATVTTENGPPTVTGISVSPAARTVEKGQTETFTATVQGTNNPPQTVSWSVAGGGPGTSISSGGVLTVAANESAANLTVRATSTHDASKSGTATVTVVTNIGPPTVTGISISPVSPTVMRGQTEAFAATVWGTNNPPQTVVWSVEGGGSGTSITAIEGVLTVGAAETATSLIVRATSTFDATKSGMATVTVPAVSSVAVSPGSATVLRGQTQTFTATAAGTGSPPQTVTWNVEGGGSGTFITGGALTVGANETATSLTVRATSTYDASKSGTATVTVPAVSSVTVNPGSATVIRGQTQTFTATVTGTGSPPQTVTWNVEGGGPGTFITSGGLLTVAANETASSLTVRATSTYDATKSGTATVTVPAVSDVTVSPGSATVIRGQTQTFTATVTGTGSPPQTVTWNVEGGGSGTSITTGGFLTVATNETALSLTVRATSTYDNTKSGTATVTVPPSEVSSVTVSPGSAAMIRGQTAAFTATVWGTNNPPQTVTWNVTGGGPGTSITSGGVLSVGATETATSLTVRATSTYDTSKSGTATVTVSRITGFSIGGYAGTINGTQITVSYPYDDSSQITILTPTLTVTANTVISPSSGTARDFTGPVIYTVTGSGGAQETYTVTLKNSRAKITGFSFANPPATGIINEADKTIAVEVPFGSNITALSPAVLVSPGASVSPVSGAARNFTSPVTYTVTAENGAIATYTVTVAKTGQGGGVTLIFPEDAAAGAFPDTIVLSKSGAGGNPVSQTLTVSGVYDSYLWRVDGTIKEYGKTMVLNAANYATGTHQISVEVTRNGAPYSKSGAFRVEN